MGRDREYVLGRPTGGVNTRTYPTELGLDEFAMLKNIDPFANIGAFVTRRGSSSAWNDTLPVSNKTTRDGFRFYFGTSSRHLIIVAGASIWYKSGSAGSFSTLLAGVTEDLDWSFAAYLDHCYMCNGTDTMKRWNGTAVRAAGFPAPASAPSVATGAAGVLTGAYLYKVSAVYDSNSAHESSVYATASATVNPSAQKVELTSIPTITNATARNLYRTKAGGTIYYYLATIADNSTTTYSDNIADTALSETTAPEDNGVPPAGKIVLFWRGRMVVLRTAAYPSRVYFSSLTSTEKSPGGGQTSHGAGAEIFPASHYIDIGDDNLPITGGAIIQDQVVVFKENQIWHISGDDGIDLKAWCSQSNIGCLSQKTVVNFSGSVFFLGRTEGGPTVYLYDGSYAENVSLPIEPRLREIMHLGAANLPAAGMYRGCYMLSYRNTSDYGGVEFGFNREIAVFDTRPPKSRWLFFDQIEAFCFIPFNGPGDSGEMYYGHALAARVLRLDYGALDVEPEADETTLDTDTIAGTIETGWLDLGAPYHLKTINWIDIYGKVGSESGVSPSVEGHVTIERRYDFSTSGPTLGCAAVNVSTASKHMSRNLWKHRIHTGGSEATDPEVCYRMKLVITTYDLIDIHRIVINYTPHSPEDTHGQA